ncbi:hypothetical protein MUK42_00900 [Musa troglodytarum]|uniref:Uncharacterized protein n=1 Tax=Musa troglodytarum TaxID=320322 RepID=A0A9E7JU95_9LILI|nr:hypothetical protein MUK42_00900 [Musa troglodytarum]
MLSSSTDLPKSSLQIKQDDKFYTRILSKESSVANPSFRVYYGVATGAVPFYWESQPGTPKHISSTTALPPLTPPPSFYYSPRNKSSKKPTKSSLVHAILPKLSLMRRSSSSSVSLSSSSVSSSSSSTASGRSNHQRRPSSPQSYFQSRGDDEDSDDESPTSTLCFRSCQPVVPVKSALLSAVRHGSGHATSA